MAKRSWVTRGVAVLLVGLVGCTGGDDEPHPTGAPARTPSSASPTATTSERPAPTPTTDAQRVRAVLRDPAPAVSDVIALAKAPMSWTKAKGRLLVEYGVMPRNYWPSNATLVAVQILDRNGRVRGEWVDGSGGEAVRDYWPVGTGFVGLPAYRGTGVRPILVRDGTIVELTRVPGARTIRRGEVRFGRGWLLDEAARTVTHESRIGCRRDSIRTDLERRTWCLDHGKKNLMWTRPGDQTWARHPLSTSYFDFCDGGMRGADVVVRGDVVVVGLWRADFSLDAGATWHSVELPTTLVNTAPGGLGDNCPWVEPLTNGRLILRSFAGVALATDSTNSRFALVRPPRGTQLEFNMDEGVLTAASRRPYGDRYASYDGGRTWQLARPQSLLRHLLPDA